MGLSNKKSSDRRAARNVLDGYEPPSWEPPAPEDCDIDDPVAVDLDATTRIIQRFHRQWGRIVDYAIILQTHDGDEWIEVSKIDCCHAEVHIHHRRQSADDKRDVIREIRSQEDVEQSVDTSIETMFNHYEDFMNRWKYNR